MTSMETKQRLREPFDMHLHSNRSDGSDTPAEVVKNAAQRGVTLMALTDHDNTDGIAEAAAEAERQGVRLLPSIEMDTEWPHELHILGLDIDINEPRLQAALETALSRRGERNAAIAERLLHAGLDIRPHLGRALGSTTRLNIALALVKGGYAESTREAFARYLHRGGPGYYHAERFQPEQVIQLILGADGVPVIAHPMNGHPDLHRLAPMLAEYGLKGLEGYHPTLSEGDSVVITSIARQLKLLVTCGSDYHGAHRQDVLPGQTWRDTAVLRECRACFEARPRREIRHDGGAKDGSPARS